jgi:hypothetical protein
MKGIYSPAGLETYLMRNARALGYDVPFEGFSPLSGRGYREFFYDVDSSTNWEAFMDGRNITSGCELWLDKKNPMYSIANAFKRELKAYQEKVDGFKPIADLRTLLSDGEANRDEVCQQVELDPVRGLLGGFFKDSKQLSRSRSVGYIEPLFPPMRHPGFCQDSALLLDLHYMVHDFGHMCRKLKKTSRTVLVDMGASLSFHDADDRSSPALYLASLYRRFGFPFDHVYAYEVTPQYPEDVFRLVPEDMQAAFHWINVGVSGDPDSQMNPFRMLLKNYNEDDLIVVKLDIDSSKLEMTLALQLLNDPRLHGGLVDHFYFEHHVFMKEIAKSWKSTMYGTIADSMQLFHSLRQKGVAAHFWV